MQFLGCDKLLRGGQCLLLEARELRVVEAGEISRAYLAPGERYHGATVGEVPSGGPLREADALSASARATLHAGNAALAASQLAASADAQIAAGCMSCAGDDLGALAYVKMNHLADREGARAALERIAGLTSALEAQARVPYFEGIIAYETGDARRALLSFSRAEGEAERLQMGDDARAARQMRAMTLQSLGLNDQAQALLHDLAATASTPCERADLANDLGWLQLGMGEDAQPRFRRALELYRDECPNALARDNVQLNLALTQLRRGAPKAAKDELAAVSHADERLSLWSLDVAGQIALLEKRFSAALEHFGALRRKAATLAHLEMERRAVVGIARTRGAMRQPSQALVAFAEAELLLDRAARLAPYGEARDSWLETRCDDLHMQLLLDAGRTREAFALARRARVRGFWPLTRSRKMSALSAEDWDRFAAAVLSYRRERAALSEQAAEDWQLAGRALAEVRAARERERLLMEQRLDAELARVSEVGPASLPPLPAEAATVLVHTLTRGSVVFVATGDRVEARRLLPDERLPSDVAARLGAAPRIRLLAQPSNAVLFAGWEDLPLMHALDVAEGSSGRSAANALIISDTRSDLAGARSEARHVLTHYPGALHLFGEMTTPSRVLDALTTANVFHYAGHGFFAGNPWLSALPLAHGHELSVADIITLPRVPRQVFLAGCNTGRETHTRVASINLAHAFVLAGAEAVIAARRPVSDTDTNVLVSAYYDALERAPDDPLSALQHAKHALHASSPDADAAAFVLFVP